MSFVKLNSGNFASNSIILNPKRTFVSSSMGVTGALKVIVNRSQTQKDNVDMREGLTGENKPQTFSEYTYEGRRIGIFENLKEVPQAATDFDLAILLDGTGLYKGQIPEYEKYEIEVPTSEAETGYSDIDEHPRNTTELLIRNLKPGSSFHSSGSRALALAERILQKEYSVSNSKYGSKYTNYNCFNFFSTDYKSQLVYRNANNKYNTADNFTIEFYVKVNHSTGSNTVMHLPGDFCISIISGSETSETGYPTRYAIASQHGVSASLNAPLNRPDNISSFDTDSQTGGFAKQSNFDIQPERWHNCVIRYDGSFKTIEYLIDNIPAGKHQLNFSPSKTSGRNLILGANYSGTSADLEEIGKSYEQNTDITLTVNNGGSQRGNASPSSPSGSPDSGFNNFANINLHEIKIWNKFLSRNQIITGSKKGYTGSAAELSNLGLQLYIPCLYDADMIRNNTMIIEPKLTKTLQSTSLDSLEMFNSGTQSSTHRDWNVQNSTVDPSLNTLAKLFANKIFSHEKIYQTPYNTNHASIGGFANINLQNFAKDFVNTVFPLAHNMSESLLSNADAPTNHAFTSSFSSIAYHQKRNCFILPCDNGNFKPGYEVLTNITGTNYIIENGETINTKNIADLNDAYDSSLFFIDEAFSISDTFITPIMGTTIEQAADARYNSGASLFLTAQGEGVSESDIPDVKIPDSAEISTFFDPEDFVGNLVNVISIPQLYYGDSLKRKSIELKAYLHKDSKSEIILKDDGEGNLYRHQTSGSVATWNNVGDVYYNEGLIYVRNPSLYAIGDQNLELSFEGIHKVNSYEINILADKGLVNSSSNPNYNKLKPSLNENESDDDFVYISTIYLHDDNLNVVGKAKFAQPIIKRSKNKFLFRLRVDF